MTVLSCRVVSRTSSYERRSGTGAAGELNHMTGKAIRTSHRSSSGTKLYAVRDANGRFKDIQTYKRAHGSDIKRQAKSEK